MMATCPKAKVLLGELGIGDRRSRRRLPHGMVANGTGVELST